jgi:hypothetical protein
MTYTETLEYNKYQQENSNSPCPNGLMGIYDCNGNLVGCVTPNDAAQYKNDTVAVPEGYTKLKHPTTNEFLGILTAEDACKMLECLSGVATERDFSLIDPTSDEAGFYNFADAAIDEQTELFDFKIDRNNCFEDVVATITSADGITFSTGATTLTILEGSSVAKTKLEWTSLAAGTYLFKIAFVACGKTKEINCKLTLS